MNSTFFTELRLYSPEKYRSVLPARFSDRFLAWYHSVVLCIAVAAIYSNLPIYGYIVYPSMLPKFTFFSIFILIIPLIIIKYKALGAYLLSPFVLWAAVLLALNLIHLAGFSPDGYLGGVALIDHQMVSRYSLILTRTQYILFAIFLGFAFLTSTRKVYLYTFVLLAAILPCAVILDFARPGLLYPIDTNGAVLGRAAAMFINPTMAGEALLLVFLLGCAAIKLKYRAPLFILLGAAVLMTFSRSSIIAWVLLWPILLFKKVLPKSAIVILGVVLGISLAFLGSFENYLQARQEFDGALSNILSRLDFFSNFKLNDDSSEERSEVIRAGWDLFLQNPVFGAGAGATQFWSHRGSTHNQLLLMAAEYGIFGIGLWISLLVILCRGNFFDNRGLQFAIVFLFAFMSMFTHQMFDSASYWLATFAIVSVRKNRAVLGWPSGMARKFNLQERSAK
jgi:O-antigen ligase